MLVRSGIRVCPRADLGRYSNGGPRTRLRSLSRRGAFGCRLGSCRVSYTVGVERSLCGGPCVLRRTCAHRLRTCVVVGRTGASGGVLAPGGRGFGHVCALRRHRVFSTLGSGTQSLLFGARVGVIERHEGNGRSDAVRLLTGGILRGV